MRLFHFPKRVLKVKDGMWQECNVIVLHKVPVCCLLALLLLCVFEQTLPAWLWLQSSHLQKLVYYSDSDPALKKKPLMNHFKHHANIWDLLTTCDIGFLLTPPPSSAMPNGNYKCGCCNQWLFTKSHPHTGQHACCDFLWNYSIHLLSMQVFKDNAMFSFHFKSVNVKHQSLFKHFQVGELFQRKQTTSQLWLLNSPRGLMVGQHPFPVAIYRTFNCAAKGQQCDMSAVKERQWLTYSSKSCNCLKICQDSVVSIGFLDRFLRERMRKRQRGKTNFTSKWQQELRVVVVGILMFIVSVVVLKSVKVSSCIPTVPLASVSHAGFLSL